MKHKPNPNTPKPRVKKKYVKPRIRSEEMITFGAQCNGMQTGGRKATAGSPDFCSGSLLLS